jgi:hypothetical protein
VPRQPSFLLKPPYSTSHSPSLSLSLSLPPSLTHSLTFSLSLSIYISLSLFLSFFLSFFLSLSLSLSLFFSLSQTSEEGVHTLAAHPSKNKARLHSKRSSFRQSVSMCDYYINSSPWGQSHKTFLLRY